jgi:putative membrane protein
VESNQQVRLVNQTGPWIFAVVAIVALASLVIVSSLFGGRFSPGYPPFFFFGWWWILIPLFFGFFFFIRGYWWWNLGGHRSFDPALETLRERFARGEITRQQYDQMRKDLEVR